MSDAPEHVGMLILGAGLSGIGAAHHFQSAFPGREYAILEAREASGGTWDLFRYPGVRSDSDMHTLGYRFRPWTHSEAIADGASILRYIRDTASEAGIDRHIRLGHRVVSASWSSAEALWTVEALHHGEPVRLTADFLFVCGGYYRYDAGHTPDFPGIESFRGTVVHPQHWPGSLDYTGRKVVVIGSGATAVTLVPAMAEDTAHITMLQRSPSYIMARPARDRMADRLVRMLGARGGYAVTRWKNVVMGTFFYQLSRRRPHAVKRMIRQASLRQLPDGFDVDTHFKPRYQPWDQRLCLAPDGDLFTALREGKASVVTDDIDTFTRTGIRLRSGAELDADIVVTATGLRLLPLGGIRLSVDGRDVALPETMVYKGVMLSGVPNFAFTFGYTNSSWTLKADLVSEYVVRLLRHLERHGHDRCVPMSDGPAPAGRPMLDFDAGYVKRAIGEFPQSGSRAPWQVRMNYPYDIRQLRHGRIDDGTLRFSRRTGRRAEPHARSGADGSGSSRPAS